MRCAAIYYTHPRTHARTHACTHARTHTHARTRTHALYKITILIISFFFFFFPSPSQTYSFIYGAFASPLSHAEYVAAVTIAFQLNFLEVLSMYPPCKRTHKEQNDHLKRLKWGRDIFSHKSVICTPIK